MNHLRHRHNKISKQLAALEDKEVIRGWQCQGDQPGYRWFVEGFTFDTRGFSTSEAEAFLVGVDAAWEAARVEVQHTGTRYLPALTES